MAVVVSSDSIEESRAPQLLEKELRSRDDLCGQVLSALLPAYSEQVLFNLDEVDFEAIALVDFEQKSIHIANYYKAILDLGEALQAQTVLHQLLAAFDNANRLAPLSSLARQFLDDRNALLLCLVGNVQICKLFSDIFIDHLFYYRK